MIFKKGKLGDGFATVLGRGTIVEGKVETDESVLIGGTLRGEISTRAALTVSEGARVEGDIRGENVTVAGEVKGNIRASGETVITPTGQVVGDISTAVLSISPGAAFVGKSLMKPQERQEQAVKPAMETEEETT